VKALASSQKTDALSDFVTTRWSLIHNGHISGVRTDANPELAQLCQIYLHPIFTFIYRRGYSAPGPQDLTQDFFSSFCKPEILSLADFDCVRRYVPVLQPRVRASATNLKTPLSDFRKEFYGREVA
jgi:hypothetical protein